MPSSYAYPDDGKLHTRFTELVACTPTSVGRVVTQRLDQGVRHSSEILEFGTDRHDDWRDQTKRTGKIPACFLELPDLPAYMVDWVEQEIVHELVPGVVIHGTPDAVCKASKTVVDYKTVQSTGNDIKIISRRYRASNQAMFYAMLLSQKEVEITNGIYLLELWNPERTQILGYHAERQEYSLLDLARMVQWAIDRCSMLRAELNRQQSERTTPCLPTT